MGNWLVAIGDLFTLIAVLAALRTVILTARATKAAQESVALTARATEAAQETVNLTTTALREAELARVEAERQRREAVRDRQRDHLERVGRLVEEIFWSCYPNGPDHLAGGDDWKPARNVLRHVLIGLSDQLPECARLVGASSAGEAAHAASGGRAEVEHRLRLLDSESGGWAT